MSNKDIDEVTRLAFSKSQDDWLFRFRVHFTIAGMLIVMMNVFIRVWWLNLIIFLLVLICYYVALLDIYYYGQTRLVTSYDRLKVHYRDYNDDVHAAYLLSEEAIKDYIPYQVYFLTNLDGEIILDKNNEMLVFSDLDKAKDFGKKLKEDSRVMLLHLNTGEASE